MANENNKKIITLSFVAAGFLAAFVVNILLETFAAAWGAAARMISHDVVGHGLPIITGLLTFGVLQFNTKIVKWADEVVNEVSKVVWPSKQDTVAMTWVVSFMLLVSGLLLGLFDFISNYLVKFIVNLG